jgi:tetratricopeptide (TPR) repeat protein
MRRHLSLLFLPALLLAACGHDPAPRSDVREAAVEANQRAQAAFKAGDYEAARDHTRRALDLYRALDDADGVATELVNLSVAQLAAGDVAGAIATLDPFFANPGLEFSAAQRAEAAYRRAWIARRTADARETDTWLTRAEGWCRGECPANGRLLNLRAQIALEGGDLATAREQATRAVAANRKTQDRVEEANAVRLLANVAASHGDHAGARAHFEQALALDKETGQAAKIHADLIGIGLSLRAQGRGREAVEYFERARSVAQGAGDETLLRAAETLIRDSAR